MIAKVAVDMRAKPVDRLYDYIIPDHVSVEVGSCVEIPFGQRVVTGYVLALIDEDGSSGDSHPLRPIVRALTAEASSLHPEMMGVMAFLKDRYLCTWGAALQTVLPPMTRAKASARYVLSEHADEGQLDAALFSYIKRYKGITKKTLIDKFGITKRQLDMWVAQDVLQLDVRHTARLGKKRISSHEHAVISEEQLESALPLSIAQEEAYQQLSIALHEGKMRTFVLHGVTGSGKTEVYLQAIECALQAGHTALMLVPEIALTAQMTTRFRRRFGQRIAVLHSRLSDRERYEEWNRIVRKEADVVVGARSAIFAPLSHVGLIIIDEEHEQTYKQESDPRYVVREVAEWRAKYHRAVVVLGSATPSLETMYRVERERYTLLTLPDRIGSRPLAEVQVVDMRAEFRKGLHSLFSEPLKLSLEQVLEREEQAILFLNRRGYTTILLCRDCGAAATCPDCDLSLTLHKVRGASVLRCHFCGHMEPLPTHCVNCGSTRIRQFGAGTQKVEQALVEQFSGVRVIRMDVDTTGTKGAHERMLGEFERGEADVLLGTQMIAKGLDFGRVTLVGVVAADTSLHIPDFRAAERTFQLLVQVAGRAGRHDLPGKVVIQTFSPDHYAIMAAQKHDYAQFFVTEMAARKAMQYPPYTEITQFLIAHDTEQVALQTAQTLHEALLSELSLQKDVRIFAVVPASVPRLRGVYRYQITVLYPSFMRVKEGLSRAYQTVLGSAKFHGTIAVDVNAQMLF